MADVACATTDTRQAQQHTQSPSLRLGTAKRQDQEDPWLHLQL